MKTFRALTAGILTLLWTGTSADMPAQSAAKLIHVFVALADNKYQGIVPVPAALGNGDDPAHNLYWGAAYGVRTFFDKSSEWTELATVENPNSFVLERTIFLHAPSGTILLADAYRGREIKQAILDFYGSAAGQPGEKIAIPPNKKKWPGRATDGGAFRVCGARRPYGLFDREQFCKRGKYASRGDDTSVREQILLRA